MEQYDVLVIGAGPGGYVAAIRAAQLGIKTACVERWLDDAGKPALGGVCLNIGCIPSKALLDSSHQYEHIVHQSKEHGITVGDVSFDVAAMQKRKDKVVRTLTQGIAGLFRKNGVEWLQGHARLLGGNQVAIVPTDKASGEKTVWANNIIIATGSVPATLPQAAIDNDRIVDSTGALAFSEVPPRLGIIGAGVIGLELGTVWRRLGSQVVLLEALSDFLPSVDSQIAQEALKIFKKQGLDIRLGSKVLSAESSGQEVVVRYEEKGNEQSITVDKLVVAVGRKPVTDDLGLSTAGVQLNPRGFIGVDEFGRTNIPGIYAIGDVVGGPMLAHKASEEGMAVAEHIAGQKSRISHETVPWVIYTWPEIAWVGQTEQALRSEGHNYRTGFFPFLASGRARAMGDTTGLVKIIGDAETDQVLGVHIFGPNASELIAEMVLAMEFAASTEDIARTIHAHPTLAEALHEAALAVDQRAIHL
jgi:dihydrolipoamide dehydrogenase